MDPTIFRVCGKDGNPCVTPMVVPISPYDDTKQEEWDILSNVLTQCFTPPSDFIQRITQKGNIEPSTNPTLLYNNLEKYLQDLHNTDPDVTRRYNIIDFAFSPIDHMNRYPYVVGYNDLAMNIRSNAFFNLNILSLDNYIRVAQDIGNTTLLSQLQALVTPTVADIKTVYKNNGVGVFDILAQESVVKDIVRYSGESPWGLNWSRLVYSFISSSEPAALTWNRTSDVLHRFIRKAAYKSTLSDYIWAIWWWMYPNITQNNSFLMELSMKQQLSDSNISGPSNMVSTSGYPYRAFPFSNAFSDTWVWSDSYGSYSQEYGNSIEEIYSNGDINNPRLWEGSKDVVTIFNDNNLSDLYAPLFQGDYHVFYDPFRFPGCLMIRTFYDMDISYKDLVVFRTFDEQYIRVSFESIQNFVHGSIRQKGAVFRSRPDYLIRFFDKATNAYNATKSYIIECIFKEVMRQRWTYDGSTIKPNANLDKGRVFICRSNIKAFTEDVIILTDDEVTRYVNSIQRGVTPALYPLLVYIDTDDIGNKPSATVNADWKLRGNTLELEACYNDPYCRTGIEPDTTNKGDTEHDYYHEDDTTYNINNSNNNINSTSNNIKGTSNIWLWIIIAILVIVAIIILTMLFSKEWIVLPQI